MPGKPIELPPGVAKAFLQDMRAFSLRQPAHRAWHQVTRDYSRHPIRQRRSGRRKRARKPTKAAAAKTGDPESAIARRQSHVANERFMPNRTDWRSREPFI